MPQTYEVTDPNNAGRFYDQFFNNILVFFFQILAFSASRGGGA